MEIKNRTKIKSKSPTALNWFKNVGKSLGYTTTELIEEMIPAPIDFIKSNTETFKNFYNDLRQSKSLSKKLSDQMVKNEYINIGQTAIKNALKDIKSGKIYNKDRQNEIFKDDIDFEFGDELNFENDDYKVSSETTSESGSPTINRVIVSSNINRNNPMVKAVERQTEAIYNTTQASDKISISLATNHMMINRKLGEDLNRGLSAINDNLSLLVNFQSESMTRYISTTFKYYEESLNAFNNIHNQMKKGSSEEKVVKEKVDPMESVFLSKGGLNLSGYANLVKKQFGAAVDQDMILSQLKYMLSDKDQLKFLAASPISFLSTKIVSAFIPSMLKQTLTSMNKSFENFFPALLMKANRMVGSDNPILNFLGQVFGINVKQKSSVDLSQYDKGAVPFDGQTRKSITEVIPGYLRKILAALNGKEEVGFDYDKGIFNSMDSMKKDFQSTVNRTVLNSFSDVMSEIKDKANAFNIQNDEERKKFNKDLESFFLKLPTLNKLVNPVRTKDKSGANINELKNVHDFGSEEMNNFFRQIVLSLNKGDIQKMFGADVLNARKNKEKIFTDMENDPLRYNAAILNNQLSFDDHIKRNKNNRNQFEVKKGFGVLSRTDQFGKSDLDYFRDIKEILLRGIKVFPVTQLINPDGSVSQPSFEYHDRQLRRMRTQERERDRKFKVKPQQDIEITPELERINRQQGKKIVNRLSNSDITAEEMRDQIRIFDEQRRSDSERDRRQQSGWLSSFISGDMQTKYNLLREKVRDIFNTPAKLLNTVFKKIDNSMFKIIFGDDESGNSSFLNRSWALMQSKFQTMTEWFKDKIFTPIRESLFGPNGFITKLKDSEFFKGVKSNFSKLTDFLFGLKDSTGKRKGGMFSDTSNHLLDIFDNAKYYFTGKAYINRSGVSFPSNNKSVFGELKSMFSGFKNTITSYLFGRRNQDGNIQEKGVLSTAVNSIKDGFQNFSDAIFGPRKIGGKDNKNYVIVGDLFKKFKERLPKALSFGIVGAGSGLLMGGKLGLLGSLFLPGGPLGGAIVGTTVGFLSQSDKFKDWLFGPKDINGTRIGGYVTKKTQEFFKKNKVGIVGGATLGALKSILGFGFLPSFFLPGGPIGGALFGVGVSMLASSEKFKKFMFGDLKADGTRLGGIAEKVFGKVDKAKAKKMFGNVSAGILGGAGIGLITSKFGLLGAALLPGGPLGGALLGAAAGIALSSEKWKKALFGEFDEETQLRKGGILGKVINWTNLEVLQPFKIKLQEINLNVKEWFTRSIANPFLNAIDPIKHEIKLMIRSLKDNFVEGWTSFKTFIGDVFEKHVGVPFGKFMEDRVMKPLRGFMSKILGGIGRIVGSIVSAPFKGMEGLSKGLTKKHMQAGLDAYVEEGWNDLLDFKGRRERKERMGFFGGLKKFKDIYFNRQARADARNSSQGAPYAKQLEIDRQKREDDANAEFGSKREEIRKMWSAWRDRKRAGINNNYDNFSPDGKVVRGQYSSPEERRNEQMSSNPINDTTNNINNRTGGRRRGRPNPKPVNDQSVIILPGSIQQGDTSSIVDDVTDVINKRTGGSRRRGKKSTTSPTNQPNINQQQTEDSSISQPTISQITQPTKKTSIGRIKSKDELIIQIAGDVRTIAKEVNGQLDGVGGNVYKIRKLIQSQQGISDEDLSGSSNRDRVGLLGKVRKMLYKPIDTIKEKVMGSIQFVTDKITSVGKKIFDFSKTILVTVPKQIFSTMYNIGSEILSIGKETFLTIVKLPGQLLNLFAQTTKIFAESVKMIAPAIGETLKGVAKLFSGTMGMIAESMIGIGKGIGQVAYGIGEAIGSTISTFTKGLMSIVPVVGDFLLTSTKMIMDFGFGVMKSVGGLLTSATKSLFKIATSPLRFAADLIGRSMGINRSEMYITGGIIDVVRQIGDNKSNLTNNIKGTSISNNIITPVKIVGSDRPIPVYFNINQSQQRNSSFNVPGLPPGLKNMGSDISSSLLGALNLFDNQNDIEEENRQKERNKESELQQDQKDVSRKTAGFLIAQNNLRNEKDFTRNNEVKQTSLLQRIADTTKSQHDSWLSIFGSKGLLTAGLLLLIPYLKDIIQWIKGKFPSIPEIGNGIINLGEKNDESRQDVDENGVTNKKIINGQYRESLVKGGLITARRHGSKIVNSLAGVTDKIKNSNFTKNIVKYGSNLKNAFSTPNVVRNGAIDVSFKVTDETGKIVKEVTVNDSNKIIQAIKNTFERFFNNSFVKNKLGPAAAKISSTIINTVTKVLNYKSMFKYMGKLSMAFLKTGAKIFAAPVIISWDLATGAYEASRIFKVREESIDTKMRIASSITKSLVGFFPVIDILSEIFNEQTGTSLKQYVATTIYSILASSEELKKLEMNEKVFEEDKDKYNKENNTNLSLNAFNDKQNKTFFQKFISNPLSKVKNDFSTLYNKSSFGDFTNNFSIDKTRSNLGLFDDSKVSSTQRVLSGISGFVESSTLGYIKSEKVGRILETGRVNIVDGVTKFTDSIKDGWNNAVTGVKKSWSETKNDISNWMKDTNTTLGKLFGFKDDNGDDVSFTTQFNKKYDEILKGVRDSWNDISEGARTYWNSTKDFVAEKWKKLTEKLPKAFENFDKWLGSLLGFKDNKGNAISVTDFASNKVEILINKVTESSTINQIKEARKQGKSNEYITNQLVKQGYSTNKINLLLGGNGSESKGGFGEEPNQLNNFAYYSQYDDRWGKSKYDLSSGHSIHPTLSARGCGPTSMAMVVSQLTGKRYEPPQLAKIAQDGGYSTNDGTTWGYFNKVAKDFSLDTSTINPSNTMNYLNNGMPVILSGKRDKYPLTESPFTPGGHYVVAVGRDANGNVLINDPRGPKFSKLYNFDKVTKEARQGWAFSYNGGTLPPNIVSSDNNNELNSGTNKKLTTLDLFAKMTEAFTLYNENLMNGTNKLVSWDEEGKSNDFNVSITNDSNNSLTNFIPKTLQESILKKTLELSVGSESSGDYTSSNNDRNASTGATISPSIGILQWRGNNAKSLMQRMYEQLPGNSEANYFANQVNWGNQSPWSESQRARLKKFLRDNISVSQKVQNDMALSYIRDTNLAPVYKYGVDTNKIKDPRSIAFLADFANTGPNLVKTFLAKYNPDNGGKSEFEHFMDEFKNKSYWGNKGIYSSRIKNTYSKLSGWTPEVGGNGNFSIQSNFNKTSGGFGEDSNIIFNNNSSNSNKFSGGLGDLTSSVLNKYKSTKIRYNRNIFESLNNRMGEYINNSNSQNSNISLNELITVLKEIAINTNTTSKGIAEIANKDLIVNISNNNNNEEKGNNQVNNINVNSQQPKNTFVTPFFQSMNEKSNNNGNSKEQREYEIAKKIAGGRTL